MKIINAQGEVLTAPDLTLGYLQPERRLLCHHEAVPEQAMQFHLEEVESFPNGGKIVERIIDTPHRDAQAAWDEYEEVLVYTPYTQQELVQMEIADLKEQLANTDYVACKAMDLAVNATGLVELLSAFTQIRTQYAQVLRDRESWRQRIRQLEP